MNVTKKEYKALAELVTLAHKYMYCFNEEEKEIYKTARATMEVLHNKRKAINEKTWEYIKEKRKYDADYARSK